MLHNLGIQSPLRPVPSLALGDFETTPLELAGAYAVLDNDGQKPFLLSVKEVVTEIGEIQERRNVEIVPVTTPGRVYLITNILEGAVQNGTAREIKNLGVDFPCAAYAGVSSDDRDSWFVGYTADLLVLVWLGYDDNRPTQLSGSQGAARIWVRFYNQIRPWIHPQEFRIPPGVVQRLICTESGQLATAHCGEPRLDAFLNEHVPKEYCTIHQ